jgi:gelsolin
MLKKEVFKVEDSNVAGLGSDLDKKCREAAAQGEKAWAVAGKKPGMQIWRIEQFKVVVSQTPRGTFYSDDSYICLNTYKKKDANGKETEALAFDIHFWLGATTSQDEAGTAAYKTVELDDFLHQVPVQHREVQGYESQQFLDYFNDVGGIKLLEGGVASGFRHVEPEKFKPRLLWLKGRRNIRVTQVPILAASFNEGDVFVLDMGLTILTWQGKSAGKNEKGRAGQLCRALDDERKGKPKQIVYNQTDRDVKEFWAFFKDLDPAFGSWTNGIPTVGPDDGKDEEWEKASEQRMFKLSDSTGSLQCTEVVPAVKGKYKRGMLESGDVFIFDAGNEIFVWVGSGASAQEKREAMKYAADYMKKFNRNPCLPITKILEGSDSNAFKSYFTG